MNCCAVSGQERWDRPLLQAVLWMQGRLCGAMAYMASWRDGETEQAGQEETNRQAARLLDQYGNSVTDHTVTWKLEGWIPAARSPAAIPFTAVSAACVSLPTRPRENTT